MYRAKSKLSAKDVAVQLLSRRDHGEYELRQKLSLKEFEEDDINQALAYCIGNGWMDDLRYAKSQVRQHVYKGHGKRRIQQELNLKQVSEYVIEQAFEEEPQDWFELAKETAEKKFKGKPAEDQKAYAKQVRFLQYRGFSFDQIRYALSSFEQID
ncbi:recombination regulator RecX [Vibrio rumoiensis]|uniref:Regulatory protein RecX n=1 Tax=Vibrio rumoiensis 1S-45 TaxID=1188252 RepID=A0A1E5E599_9VIBR|nr:recombination regulator RecX [Vibrio rumoiensis]OEF27805.1 recombination regulator RecX [Vibrio rumoiensis 1S-45]